MLAVAMSGAILTWSGRFALAWMNWFRPDRATIALSNMSLIGQAMIGATPSMHRSWKQTSAGAPRTASKPESKRRFAGISIVRTGGDRFVIPSIMANGLVFEPGVGCADLRCRY